MDRFDFDATFGDDYLYFYSPVLSDERNEAETEEIVALLELGGDARVLDAPCGHGRIANRLSVRGFDVTGVDACELFLDRARTDAAAMGASTRYVRGDMRALPVEGTFDVVLCWFTSFGYFEDDDNRLVLAEYRRVLHPGGRLLIETLNRDGFVRTFIPDPFAAVTSVGDDLLLDRTTFDPMSGRQITRRTVVRDGHVAAIEEGLREVEQGETITLDELRQELRDRRPPR
jgi:SAM-dependent methyltransferase